MELRVGNSIVSTNCAVAREDRIVSKTYVGRSSSAADAYSQLNVAGLYAVDALLSEAEISKITSRMYRGDDSLGVCQTCPSNSLSLQGSMSAADCVMECPAGQFHSEMASIVARMCGPAQNEACPVAALSTVLAGSPATNGNDGLFTLVVHSQVTEGPHTFRIDLERMRNINYIMFYNRVDLFESRITGALILVGSSALWANNTICATLNINAVQVHDCKMSGKYIFIVAKTADALNFLELQVFSNCTTCPANTVSLPGSTSPAECGCPAGSYEETRLLNPSEDSRTYSSVLSVHKFSQLDSLHNEVAWIAGTNTQGQWMEIDASEPITLWE